MSPVAVTVRPPFGFESVSAPVPPFTVGAIVSIRPSVFRFSSITPVPASVSVNAVADALPSVRSMVVVVSSVIRFTDTDEVRPMEVAVPAAPKRAVSAATGKTPPNQFTVLFQTVPLPSMPPLKSMTAPEATRLSDKNNTPTQGRQKPFPLRPNGRKHGSAGSMG